MRRRRRREREREASNVKSQVNQIAREVERNRREQEILQEKEFFFVAADAACGRESQ